MSKPALSLTLSVLLLSALACGSSRTEIPTTTSTIEITPTQTEAPKTTTPPIPEDYQDLHDAIAENLDRFQDYLDEQWDGNPAGTVFGAELSVANANRGEVLLLPEMKAAVDLYLDRLQEVGVGGVTLQVSNPLLNPEFPRAAEYLDFYRQVAAEVRGRGLKLMVETGPVFADPQYSQVDYDWSKLTLDQYFQMRVDQLMLIAVELQPDYLSIGHEPSTEVMLTGHSFSLDQYLSFVQDAAASIDRSSGVLLGAGSGSWEDPAYLESLSDIASLDFINIHIYPLASTKADFLTRASEAAEYARANGKKVVIGETWLFKATPEEITSSIAPQDVYARDVYSFWQPLDIRFIQVITGLAHHQQFEYVSFFWSGFFFSYLEYDPALLGLSPVDLYRSLNQAQFANVKAGILTETGSAYQAMLQRWSQP